MDNPFFNATTPLEAAKIYLKLIEKERSQAFREGKVDSTYFLKERQ